MRKTKDLEKLAKEARAAAPEQVAKREKPRRSHLRGHLGFSLDMVIKVHVTGKQENGIGSTSDPERSSAHQSQEDFMHALSSPPPPWENISCNLSIPNDSEKRRAGGGICSTVLYYNNYVDSIIHLIVLEESCNQWLIQWQKQLHPVIFPLSFPGVRECTNERGARKGLPQKLLSCQPFRKIETRK
ncbi:hypothetical protein CDAR_389971 [Caerostris darwini]|uniref:Uncharacterized protein n=1 Tax=Caerostris darwini TaxID=1538125 RepID=A0AAV4QTN7_9ARAC|nr:hypothetical protein CDAR_389971 [Caerostris darwini]